MKKIKRNPVNQDPVIEAARDYLLISNINFPQHASLRHKEIVLAAREPKVKTLAAEDVTKTLTQVLKKTADTLHIRWRRPGLNQLVSYLETIVYRDFSHFSLDDIRLAFRDGEKNYCQSGRPDETVFWNWLSAFGEVRARVLCIQASYDEEEKRSRREDQHTRKQYDQLRALRNNLIREYNRFVETGEYEIRDLGNARYDYLDALKLVPYSKQQKEEFMAEARELYRAELQKKQEATGSHAAHRKLEKSEGDTDRWAVVVLAKKLALKSLLKELRERCERLDQLINYAGHEAGRNKLKTERNQSLQHI